VNTQKAYSWRKAQRTTTFNRIKESSMKRFSFRRTSLMATCALATLSGAAHAGTITVYTSLEEDEIKDYVESAKRICRI
jgi:hypothetical protein